MGRRAGLAKSRRALGKDRAGARAASGGDAFRNPSPARWSSRWSWPRSS